MRLVLAAALGSVSALAFPAVCMAQQSTGPAEGAEAEASEDSNIIIVQARRRDENLQEVPMVINAVSGEDLGKLNIRSATEITSVVPGLSLTPNANGIGSASSMRGVNHEVNVSGENGTIQYYVNDVPVGSNLVLQTLFDIGQISVERGPQGTLRGRSTPSGSINVNWRKPSLNEVGLSASGSYGSDDAQNLQFGIGVPVIRDMLAVRVAGLYDKGRGNRVRSVNSTIDPETETQAIRATAVFEPTDFIKAGFVYQGMRYRATQFDQVESMNQLVPGYVLPTTDQTITASLFPFTAPSIGVPASGNYGTITLSDRRSVVFNPRTVETDFKYFGWNAEVDFAGQRLIYLGSDTSTNFHPVTNQDVGAVWPALTLQQNTRTVSDGSTHEIRLQNEDRVAGMFDYVIGYFQRKGGSQTTLTTQSVLEGYAPIFAGSGNLQLFKVANIVNTTPIYLAPGAEKEESYFGNVIVHFGDSTELSAGLRHLTLVNNSGGLFISCTPAAFAAGTCTLTPRTNTQYDISKTIYNIALRHKFSDDLMVYIASGSSVRPPVRAIGDFSISYSPLEIAHTSFGAETSKSYEVGFKSSWLDRRLRFNATYYHQDFTNYPYRAPGNGIYYININSNNQPNRARFNFISAVPVKVDGVEADLSFNLSRNFSIGTTLNWSKSSISGSAKLACTDALNNSTGAIGRDGIPDTVAPTLAQLQTVYGTEHLAECPASGSATFLPEWSGTVQAEYVANFSTGLDGYVRGLLSWKGSTRNDEFNRFDDVGSYGLLNLYAGLRAPDGSWELGAYAKNVSNVTRLVSGDSGPLENSTTLLRVAPGNPLPFGSQTYSSFYRGVSVTAPREFGVTFRVALGGR